MKYTIYLIAALLFLGQISCSKDKNKETQLTQRPHTPQKKWRAPSPTLKTKKNKLLLKNIKVTSQDSLTTADSIVFDIDQDQDYSDIKLNILSVCVDKIENENEKMSLQQSLRFKPEIKLIELLPKEVLFTPKDKANVNTFCEFQFKAENAEGSKHYFSIPFAHINSSEEANTITLKNNGRHLTSSESISYNKLSSFWFSPPTTFENTSIILECDSFRTQHQAPQTTYGNFTGFNFDKIEIKDKSLTKPLEQKPHQQCRLFQYENKILKNISPYFNLKFPIITIKTYEEWLFHNHLHGNVTPHNIYSVKFKNPHSYAIKIKIPAHQLGIYITNLKQKFLVHRPLIPHQSQLIVPPQSTREMIFTAPLIYDCIRRTSAQRQSYDEVVGGLLHINSVNTQIESVVTGQKMGEHLIFQKGVIWAPMYTNGPRDKLRDPTHISQDKSFCTVRY